jgi:hypothetical protein
MFIKNLFTQGGNCIYEDDDYVAIVTWKSVNAKTGNMAQIWILNRHVNPVESVASGLDAVSNCRGCPFASGMGCYVNVGQAPLGVWKSYKNGSYPFLALGAYETAFKNRFVRFGAYGNPSIIPLQKIEMVTAHCKGWTGYFHDWHEMPVERAREYGKYFMASTETEDSRMAAEALGLRYFHVSPLKPSKAIECVSETHGKQCLDCGLCDGTNKKAKSIWINPHGSKKNKAIAMAVA